MSNDLFRCQMVWTAPNGTEHNNVVHLRIAGGDAADVADLISDIGLMIANWFAAWLSRLVAAYVLEAVKVYALDAATNVATPLGTATVGVAGSSSFNTAVPSGVRVKINIFTPLRPRPSGVYLPATSTNGFNLDGTLTAGTLTGAVATGAAMLLPYTLQTTNLSALAGVYSTKDLAFFPYTGGSVQVDAVADYQRRGKQGRGI